MFGFTRCAKHRKIVIVAEIWRGIVIYWRTPCANTALFSWMYCLLVWWGWPPQARTDAVSESIVSGLVVYAITI